jgi:hypothetical protein
MKVYIAGKITGLNDYKELFLHAEQELKSKGYNVMNPAVLPDGFTHEEYMKICFCMIDVCDSVYFLDNWCQSKGAVMEYNYAIENNKFIAHQKEIDHIMCNTHGAEGNNGQ